MTLSSVDATFLINTTNSQLPVVMSRLGSFYLPNNFSQELGSQGELLSQLCAAAVVASACNTALLSQAFCAAASHPYPLRLHGTSV